MPRTTAACVALVMAWVTAAESELSVSPEGSRSAYRRSWKVTEEPAFGHGPTQEVLPVELTMATAPGGSAPCPIAVVVIGIPATIQRVSERTSTSEAMRRSSAAPSGTPAMVSGGAVSLPAHPKSIGIAPSAGHAGELSENPVGRRTTFESSGATRLLLETVVLLRRGGAV